MGGKVNTVDGANEGGDGYSVQSDAELYECKLYEWFICGVCLVAQYKCTDREAQQKCRKDGGCGVKGRAEYCLEQSRPHNFIDQSGGAG